MTRQSTETLTFVILTTMFIAGLVTSTCMNCYPGYCSATDKCTLCVKGYFVKNNECQPCPANCADCSRKVPIICYDCKSGFYGSDCMLSCTTLCGNHDCEKNSGTCLKECQSSYYGNNCTLTCSKGCLHGKCDKNNGTCLQGCKDGYIGKNCTCIDDITCQVVDQSDNDSSSASSKYIHVIVGLSVVVTIAGAVLSVAFILSRKRRLHKLSAPREYFGETNAQLPTTREINRYDDIVIESTQENHSYDGSDVTKPSNDVFVVTQPNNENFRMRSLSVDSADMYGPSSGYLGRDIEQANHTYSHINHSIQDGRSKQDDYSHVIFGNSNRPRDTTYCVPNILR